MGKLHTLRRAILRDRTAWERVRARGRTALEQARSATFDRKTGQWCPHFGYSGSSAYRKFISKTLTTA